MFAAPTVRAFVWATPTRLARSFSLCLTLLMIVGSTFGPSHAETTASGKPNRQVPAAVDPSIPRAEMAVRMRNFEKAIVIWKEAAGRGVPEAAYRLGVVYRSGTGVEKDIREAAKWFDAAAQRGNPDAQFALGIFYQNGTGVRQNRDEALRLLGLAARGGNRKAGEHLGRIQKSGKNAYATADARILANRADPREALAQAIRAGDSGSAREALARGAPVNGAPGDSKHRRPLIFAIEREQLEILKTLLKHGADPNVRSRAGEPALIVAIRTKKRASVRELLQAGASSDAAAVSGYTPLMEAARMGDSHLVRDLIATGADAKRVLADGTSAAGIARRFGNDELSRELESRGAPILASTNPAERLAALEKRSARSGDLSPSMPPVVEAARRG